jgi:hypothetical protein
VEVVLFLHAAADPRRQGGHRRRRPSARRASLSQLYSPQCDRCGFFRGGDALGGSALIDVAATSDPSIGSRLRQRRGRRRRGGRGATLPWPT